MNTPRILVIDENVEVAQLEHAMFRLHQYNVEVTVHVDEALRRLATRRYNVLVAGAPIHVGDRFFLDVVGSDFAHLLPSTVVVTTHVRDVPLLQRCQRAGVYAIVAKPFDVEELSEIVAACIADHSNPSPTRLIGIPSSILPKSDRPAK